jgi:outer membrane protein assembly factor BamC
MRGRGARLGAIAALLLLGGCNITQTFRDATAIDYKSASKGPPLDVPPDLISPRTDDRFQVPDRAGAGTTYSAYARERAEQQTSPSGPNVLPQRPGVRMERQGSQRWLVVDQPPEKVWPVVREFWNESGFALRTESPETGIMETDWAEKRPDPRDSGYRSFLQRTLGSLYSTGERDKYRTRLETTDGKVTEIFVSHRGLVEELTGPMKDTSMWVSRPSDPELEAELLRRIMLRFAPERRATQTASGTAGATQVASAAQSPAPAPDRVRMLDEGGRPVLAMDESFDRAWRQVGLALDRGGFTVEDRDRSKGTFFVRYVDPEQEASARGVIDRVFGTGPKKDLSGRKYRIVVDGAGTSGTRVGVLGEDGSPPSTDVDRRIANQIVTLLRDQLR